MTPDSNPLPRWYPATGYRWFRYDTFDLKQTTERQEYRFAVPAGPVLFHTPTVVEYL